MLTIILDKVIKC